jgi:hypothetical protein
MSTGGGKCIRCDAMTDRSGMRKDALSAYFCEDCGIRGLGEFVASWLDTRPTSRPRPHHYYYNALQEFLASFWEQVSVGMSADLDDLSMKGEQESGGPEERS